MIKNDIKFEDYLKTLRTKRLVKKDVIRIRSICHQLYTLNQPKIALSSCYDKCILLNELDLVPFGYAGNSLFQNEANLKG